jgi:hypothetical protein
VGTHAYSSSSRPPAPSLRHDVNHCPDADDQGSSRFLRRKKKYEIMPTPLTRLRWWRVCLDEAQMVGAGACGALGQVQAALLPPDAPRALAL